MVTSSAPAHPSVARMSSGDARRTFRALLDAVSRPGTMVWLHADADVEPVVLPALALADIEITVSVVGDPERARGLARLLRRSTGAAIAEPASADLVIALGGFAAGTVGSMRRGDATHPESGARLILEAARVVTDPTSGGGSNRVDLWLIGPGARSGRLVSIEGVAAEVFELLQVANAEHPAGIDTWIVAGDGTCVGIPRSCRIEIIAEEGRWGT